MTMKKRQVVLIMTDTTRKDMLGCYGDARMKTPHLDRLAQDGIRYDRAYDCQPVCGPARSAIFTGTFPHSNGVVTNCVPMGENVKTIGQRLSDNGIPCGYVGKWHLDGFDYFGNGLCPEGWDPDYWYDMRTYLLELSEADRVRSRRSQTAYDPTWTEDMTYAHRTTDRALSYLENFRDKEFFLTVSYDEPHGPCLCPAPYNTMYRDFAFDADPVFADSLRDKPLMQRLWAGAALEQDPAELHRSSDMLALFLGCNSFVDHEIGRVLARIEKLVPDALVIYTSDHGDMLGAHRLQGKNACFYKEITNVPLIIRDGRKGAKGVVTQECASHIDLAPTILDYFDLPVPKLLEGKSILPQIKEPSVHINDYVFVEFTRYEVDHDGFGGLQMMRGVTDGRWKLSINLMDTDELYDIETDPGEVVNRINDSGCAEIRDRLHDALLRHMDDTRDMYRGYQWLVRPWRRDASAAWNNSGCTRQRENEEYESRQWDYDTGLPMADAVRGKKLYDEKR